MPAQNIAELLLDKSQILVSADKQLLQSIRDTEKSIFAAAKKFMKGLDTVGGNFTGEQSIFGFQKEITEAFMNSSLPGSVSTFLVNFDDVEELNKQITGDISNINLKSFDVSKEKSAIIAEISDALDAPRGIKTNITKPLNTILNHHVTLGTGVAEAEEALRQFILSSPEKNSHLQRYVRQISMDAVNQFDGAVNQKLATELEMSHFAYVGSAIETTRNNCLGMLGFTSQFADLQVKNRRGVYPMSAIPEIVRRSKGKAGWNPITTVDTFFVYRMGFNCRHMVQPLLLEDDALDAVKEVQQKASSSGLSGYQKNLIAGKSTTEKQDFAFSIASLAQKKRIKDAIKAAKNKSKAQKAAATRAKNKIAAEKAARAAAAARTRAKLQKLAKERVEEAAKAAEAQAARDAAELAELRKLSKQASQKRAGFDANGNSQLKDFKVKSFKKERPELIAKLDEMRIVSEEVESMRRVRNKAVNSLNIELKVLSRKFKRGALSPEEYGTQFKALKTNSEGAKIQKAHNALISKREKLAKSFRTKLVEGRESADIKMTFDKRSKVSGANKKNILGAAEWLRKFTGNKMADKSHISVFTGRRNSRAKYTNKSFNKLQQEGRFEDMNGTIHITSGEKPGVVVHEIVHMFEYQNKAILDKAVAFHESRTVGEFKIPLGRFGKGYRPNEMTKQDKFVDEYMGKIYEEADGARRSTEIMTMGVQAIYEDPARLFFKDEEYFDFIYSIFNQ